MARLLAPAAAGALTLYLGATHGAVPVIAFWGGIVFTGIVLVVVWAEDLQEVRDTIDNVD